MDQNACDRCPTERFTPTICNAEDAQLLDRIAANPELTPSPDRSAPTEEKKSSSLWAPVRRFICGTPKDSPNSFRPPPCPIINPARSAPCCLTCQQGHHKGRDCSADEEGDDEEDERPALEDDDCPVTHEPILFTETSPETTPTPPTPQLSGMCEPTSRRPSCMRKICRRPSPPRRRRLRKARNELQPQLKPVPKKPQRRLLRQSKLAVAVRNKVQRRKPPWMRNYCIDPLIWKFLKKFRRDHPSLCLEDLLNCSVSEYEAQMATMVEISDEDCDSEGSFRDAASMARALSTDRCPTPPPTPPSLQPIQCDDTTPLVRMPEPFLRACTDSCASPTSVCALSIRRRVAPPPCPEQRIRLCTPTPACSSRREGIVLSSTPIQDADDDDQNNNLPPTPPPPPPSPCHKDDVSDYITQLVLNIAVGKLLLAYLTFFIANFLFQAAFQNFMRIYQCQNPKLTMDQVLTGADCAWRKLNPKYKRLYGARVYTPTHLSPSPDNLRRPEWNRGAVAAAAGGGCGNNCCANGTVGQTLVGVLTKKLVDACKDQLISPEYRRMLRGLIGSEVTVKICDVKKFR